MSRIVVLFRELGINLDCVVRTGAEGLNVETARLRCSFLVLEREMFSMTFPRLGTRRVSRSQMAKYLWLGIGMCG